MNGKSLWKCVSRWTVFGAPFLCPFVASAAPPAALAPARETQLILYVSQSIGALGSAVRHYGLRIDQAYTPQALPSSVAFGPVRRRELLNVMLTPNAHARIALGGRLTWDFRDNQLSVGRR